MRQSQLFTAADVRQLVGLSQRQLTYWDQSALLRPSGRSANGRGSRRLYTFLDVCHLKLIKRLRQAGVSLQKIRRAIRYLVELPDEPAPLAELEVLTDGQRILIKRSDEQVLDPLAMQFVLRFSLGHLLAEVREATISMPQESNQEPISSESKPGNTYANSTVTLREIR